MNPTPTIKAIIKCDDEDIYVGVEGSSVYFFTDLEFKIGQKVEIDEWYLTFPKKEIKKLLTLLKKKPKK